MSRHKVGTGLGIVIALFLLCGCFGGEPDEVEPAGVELRGYTVPEGYDPVTFRRYVGQSLQKGDVALGKAVVYPDGTLVVTAPPDIHEGVARLLEHLGQRGPRMPIPASEPVTLRYWAILAKPIEGGEGTVRSTSRLLQPDGPLAPVLDELVETYGPMRLGLLEELTLTSLDDSGGSGLSGRRLKVEQRITRDPSGRTVAVVEISVRASGAFFHSVRTQIQLEPERFIVLAQTAYNTEQGALPAGWEPSDDIMLFLVVTEQAD